MSHTYRCYTADEIEALTAAVAASQALDVEVQQAMADVDALLTARGVHHETWPIYAAEDGLEQLADALDWSKYPMSTPGARPALVLPRVGDVWNTRFNPVTWAKINRQTRRSLDNLRRAMAQVEQPA